VTDLEVIDDLAGVDGDTITVVVQGGKVILVFETGGQQALVVMGADAREAFARAWMEACRRADGEAPAAEARDA
jgi:hypothetical protein